MQRRRWALPTGAHKHGRVTDCSTLRPNAGIAFSLPLCPSAFSPVLNSLTLVGDDHHDVSPYAISTHSTVFPVLFAILHPNNDPFSTSLWGMPVHRPISQARVPAPVLGSIFRSPQLRRSHPQRDFPISNLRRFSSPHQTLKNPPRCATPTSLTPVKYLRLQARARATFSGLSDLLPFFLPGATQYLTCLAHNVLILVLRLVRARSLRMIKPSIKI